MRYDHVWELPVIMFLCISIVTRLLLIYKMRQASKNTFGKGAKVQSKGDVWHMPRDLSAQIKSYDKAKEALAETQAVSFGLDDTAIAVDHGVRCFFS